MVDEKRYEYLDILRCIAILLIVLDHAVLIGYKLLYKSFIGEWQKQILAGKIIRVFLWESSRLGVPIFLLITGSLILNKNFEKEYDIKYFYKKNLFPIFTANEFWIIIYFLIATLFKVFDIPFIYVEGAEINLSLKEFMYEIFLFKRGQYPNIWYLPMIIGMYFFLPFVSNILKKYENILQYILILYIVLLFFYNDINYFTKVFNLNFEPYNVLVTGFSGGIYGIYIIIGWFVSKKDNFLRNINTYLLFIAGFIVIILDICLTIMNYNKGDMVSLFQNENSFFVIVLVIIIFEICKRKRDFKIIGKISSWLSKLSFSIYLIHYPIMLFIDYIIYDKSVRCTGRVLFIYCTTIIICILLCCFIPNNKIIKKYLVHMPIK